MPEYLPVIDQQLLKRTLASGDNDRLFDLLSEPLHEELYKRKDFDFLDLLSDGQKLMLSYDYLRNQVQQGGLIQFLVNSYVWLLPDMPELLEKIHADEMAILLDDVLKVYVLNIELFDKEISTEEFAKLYDELKEFEILDERFEKLDKHTSDLLMKYARQHLEEFVMMK